MTRPLAVVLSLLIAACATTSVPHDYNTRVTTHAKDHLVVHVDLPYSLSADRMTRLLLTEAAHTAIEHGAVYLRVDQVVIGDATTAIDLMTANPPAQNVPMGDVAAASPLDRMLTAIQAVSVERRQSGAISMTIGSAPPTGDHVFEASKLLDELRRGGTAMSPPVTHR